MNVFKKRPLSLILCIMLGGFSAFVDASNEMMLAGFIASLVVFVVFLYMRGIFQGRVAVIKFAPLAIAISICLAYLFNAIYLPTKHIGTTATVVGKIEEMSFNSSYSLTVKLKSETINGVTDKDTFLIQDSPSLFSEVSVGDTVAIEGMIADLDSSNPNFDARSYYLSRGYSASIIDIVSVERVGAHGDFKQGFLERTRNAITSRLKMATNAHTGGFLAALIMGDQSALDGNTKLNYSILGITHILALSGMHLVILSEAVRLILSRLKLNKRVILVISTAFCLFYMAVTGFPPSVVRAAVMLTVTNSLFLLTGSHDSYTTLPFSVTLILIVQPYAVYDISLWLSAFATLGILVFGELFNSKRSDRRKLIPLIGIWVVQSILATILSVGASYLIMLSFCDTMSIFAPIATMIFSFPINMLIFAGIALLIFEPILPLGKPVILFTDAINEAAEAFASIKWGAYSLDYPIVRILTALFSILLLSFIVFKVNRKRAALTFLICFFFVAPIVGVALTQKDRYADEFSYSSSYYNDVMLIKHDGEISLISSSRYSSSAAYELVRSIKSERMTRADNLILPSYANGTLNYTEKIISNIKIGTILLPEPKATDELSIAEAIARMLEVYGTDLRFYEKEIPVQLGPYNYHLVMQEAFEVGNATDIVYTVSLDGKYYTYLSRGATALNPAMCTLVAYPSSTVIFGAHGGRQSFGNSYALISDSVEAIYYRESHPLTDASVEYYEKKEVPISTTGTFTDIKR